MMSVVALMSDEVDRCDLLARALANLPRGFSMSADSDSPNPHNV